MSYTYAAFELKLHRLAFEKCTDIYMTELMEKIREAVKAIVPWEYENDVEIDLWEHTGVCDLDETARHDEPEP